MKSLIITKKIWLAIVALLCFQNQFAQNAAEILNKVDQVLYSAKDQENTIKMVLVDKNGNESTREAEVLQKGNDKRLFRFTSPASQAGIAFLSLPDDVMYIYMPAFGKERRIASHVKNQKFAGTDFSYDDMEAKLLASKYDPKLIAEDAGTYTLELYPKPGLETDYSKSVVKIDKNNFYLISNIYFDKGGNKMKESAYVFEKNGNYWTSKEILMKDLRSQHSTKLILSNVVYDQGISDDEFTVRKLIQ
jgi:outer membrane lipoprotein-sorting protein